MVRPSSDFIFIFFALWRKINKVDNYQLYQLYHDKDKRGTLSDGHLGLRQAPKTFYDHMVSGLTAQGFRVSKHDPCLYIHPDMLAISWVDDVVFVSRDGKKIEAMIQKLKDAGYDLDIEGEISAFLGIQIDKKDRTFSLTHDKRYG